MPGLRATIQKERIRSSTALARHPGRPCKTVNTSRWQSSRIIHADTVKRTGRHLNNDQSVRSRLA